MLHNKCAAPDSCFGIPKMLICTMPVLQIDFKALVATWAPKNWNLVAHTCLVDLIGGDDLDGQ